MGALLAPERTLRSSRMAAFSRGVWQCPRGPPAPRALLVCSQHPHCSGTELSTARKVSPSPPFGLSKPLKTVIAVTGLGELENGGEKGFALFLLLPSERIHWYFCNTNHGKYMAARSRQIDRWRNWSLSQLELVMNPDFGLGF